LRNFDETQPQPSRKHNFQLVPRIPRDDGVWRY